MTNKELISNIAWTIAEREMANSAMGLSATERAVEMADLYFKIVDHLDRWILETHHRHRDKS